IFYHSPRQKAIASASKQRLNSSGRFNRQVVTPVEKFTVFNEAEEAHQDYYKKNPEGYVAYRIGSGREEFLAKHWGVPKINDYPSPSKAVLKEQLSKLQYQVTMEEATEPAFDNPYDKNKAPGIYVCIVSGAPLFSSRDKFDSKTGWPSFTRPIDARSLGKPGDTTFGKFRGAVGGKFGDSHVGHVFNDGPNPTDLRYCMNSAALRFVPKDSMEQQGYGQYTWVVQ